MDHAAFDTRFAVAVDVEPAVPNGVAQIVLAGFVAGIVGIVLGAAAGFGLWGLVLCYILAGNLGVASVIATKALSA